MKTWVNGRLSDAPMVSAADHGFTVGDGVFETLKTINGRPFALTRHLRRLRYSAVGMLMVVPDTDLLTEAIESVLDPKIALGRLRITLTSGSGGAGSSRSSSSQPTLVVTHQAATPWPDEATVITLPWPRNEHSPLSGLKTISYAENVLALARAHQAGADEALFANIAGHLCEGTGSNVLLRFGDQWVTPPLASGCLAGITRELAVEWLDIQERDVSMSDVRSADALVLTSSTRDLQAVGELDNRRLPGSADDATLQIQSIFRRQSLEDIDP
jgi:branched-chain amino acid aminotransferase